MEEIYTDKEILGDGLTAQKTSTSVYNTFANECAHESLRNVMMKVLEEEHTLQDDVFQMMHKRGLNLTPEAEDKKVEEAKQKYACSFK